LRPSRLRGRSEPALRSTTIILKGWVWVLRGRVFEILDGKKNYYQEGDSFLEVPNGSTHIVGNDSEEVAVTFHVYKPELEMDIFKDDAADVDAIHNGFAE